MTNIFMSMKKKLKRSLFHISVIGLSLISLETRAQGEYPLDQVPAGFGINALQTSENLSSGVLNISLPIENHIIPISLNYTTSGIRVNQRAGIVGLGWNLSAGGEITRQVRGLPDDYEEGYSGYRQRGKKLNELGLPDGTLAIKKMLNSGLSTDWDSEPDIYSFSFFGAGRDIHLGCRQERDQVDSQQLQDQRTICRHFTGRLFRVYNCR